MTSLSSDLPPFALDGTVTRDKLLELLQVQAELSVLDYKQECNLSSTRELVELTKDIGAMSILGGYLVVGADDGGQVVGLSAGQAQLFDQATLSDKTSKHLPVEGELRTAVHDMGVDGQQLQVALVWVSPHPDGWCVFARNGEYVDARGRTRIVFREGEVYARHGTRSEPWSQADIAAARSALVAREKGAWRAEHAEELHRVLQTALSGAAATVNPSSAFTWQLDQGTFEAATVEFVRHQDDVPVRRMLRAADAEVRRLVAVPGTADSTDVVAVLDRVVTVAALGLELGRPVFMDLAVQTLLNIYEWATQAQPVQTSAHRLVPVLWLRIAERLYALGALAVRLRTWPAVRELVLAPVPALIAESRGSTWHRNALTQASRAQLLTDQQSDGGTRELSLLLFARAVAVAVPALRPDLPGDSPAAYDSNDPLLDSLCQFDFLVTVISGVDAEAATSSQLLAVSYPSYARANSERANKIISSLVFDSEMRGQLLGEVDDHQLGNVLDVADQVAQRAAAAYWGWEGYADAAVRTFVDTFGQQH